MRRLRTRWLPQQTILVRLEQALGGVHGVLGHSFGGKVALEFASQRARAGAPPLEQLWVLDASPSARAETAESGTASVLGVLERLEQPLESREAFLAIVEEHGFSASVAEWLAMNVRRAPDGFRLRLDLPAIRELFEDYLSADLWAVLDEPGLARSIDVVVGGKSDAFSAEDRARLAELASRSVVRAHVLDAGHWVHFDDPEGLFALVAAALGSDVGRQ